MSSPEPKGTLTPPGSSPMRAFCSAVPPFSHEPPPSPETPMTPDSAHMAAESTTHNESFGMEGGEDKHSTSSQPPLLLTGAKKRKAAKVHKVEVSSFTILQWCVSHGAPVNIVSDMVLRLPLGLDLFPSFVPRLTPLSFAPVSKEKLFNSIYIRLFLMIKVIKRNII